MLRAFLLVFLLASLTFFGVCAYFSLVDWAELQRSDAAFRMASHTGGDMRSLFILESRQNVHRINVFADVVWALLCAIGSVLCALGLRYEKSTR